MIAIEEYELLKNYRDKGYKWIARDKDGELYVYETEPTKLNRSWLSFNIGDGTEYICDDNHLLQCIKWEDEKPTKIDDLIQDYESHQVIVGESKKVVIPSFVVEWIEYVNDMERPFSLEYLFDTTEMPDDVFEWRWIR